jgi:hypothetical protein
MLYPYRLPKFTDCEIQVSASRSFTFKPCLNKINLSHERLGLYSIATVVDDFIDRVMADPALNTNLKSMNPTTRCHLLV